VKIGEGKFYKKASIIKKQITNPGNLLRGYSKKEGIVNGSVSNFYAAPLKKKNRKSGFLGKARRWTFR